MAISAQRRTCPREEKVCCGLMDNIATEMPVLGISAYQEDNIIPHTSSNKSHSHCPVPGT